MKKHLPDNSLREKMDAVPQAFEEAHWENLAAMLHEEGREIGQEDSSNRNRFFWGLGTLLFCCSLVGMFYFLQKENTERSPDVGRKISEKWSKSSTPAPLIKEANTIKMESEKIEDSSNKSEKQASKAIEALEPPKKLIPGTKVLPESKNKIKSEPASEKSPEPVAGNRKIPPTDNWQKVEERNEQVQEGSSPSIKSADHQALDLAADLSALATPEIAVKELQRWGLTEKLEQKEAPLIAEEKYLLNLEPIDLHPFKRARKNLRFGFITGFNFSNGKPGLTFGLSLERRLNLQWYLELDMIYRGSHIDNWDLDPVNLVNYNEQKFAKSVNLLRYTDFPLMVKWRPKKKFTFYAGPKVAFLTVARGNVQLEVDQSINPAGPPIIEQRVRQGWIYPIDIRPLRTIEWGAVFGATLHLDKNIGLGFRGHLGITPFVDRVAINPSPQRRNRDLQFLVQLYF